MDIVNILERLVEKYNENCECDLCWKLVVGGRSDYFNNERDQSPEISDDWDLQPEEEDGTCCVRFGALSIKSVNGYKQNDNFTTRIYRDWNLQLVAAIPSRLDLQFYNEVRPEDTCNSKWSKFIQPIQCCIATADEDFCDIYNCSGYANSLELRAWSSDMVLNYSDRNLDGWLITATFREWLA